MISDPNTLARIRKDEQLHREYIFRFRAGDKKAINILMELHEPLIKKIGRKCAGTLYRGELEDLFQEGRIGIFRGYEKWDESRDNKALTYIVWYIKGYMLRYIKNNVSTVHLPLKKVRLGYRHVLNFEDMAPNSWSPDAPPFETTLKDESASVEDLIFEQQVTQIAHRALLNMSTREAEFVRRSIMEDETLNEIGQEHGISRERVRQVVSRCLTKLAEKTPVKGQAFEEWLTKLQARQKAA